ncbi:hypothetical protein WJX84_009655 [Apatococcus fuscideae]|uniref:[RNA-polymerase]-subunit kinase n=1 Tax=Apatococcus fuscideae TaxID=2026836 RepID=A0AAW1T6X7_9CHLO
MENYVKGETLGEGSFGVVFRAVHKQTGAVVAIKKIRLGKAKEGVNVTALREIKLLRELKGPYLVKLLDVFPHKRNLSLVFEYMESDLEAIIQDKTIILSPADIKAYMSMLFQSLDFCHTRWVVHRDVKPNNFLISATGEMKLGDFGLARIFGSPDSKYTNQVFARWYRAPELLYGSTLYTTSVDIWAAGCILAELLLRRPWLPGGTDLDQLGKIFGALGTPTLAQWPGMKALPHFLEFNPIRPTPLHQLFPQASPDCLDLLRSLVAFDPARRPSAAAALQHAYFQQGPVPTHPSQLPKPKSRIEAPLKLPPQGASALQQAPGEQMNEQPDAIMAEGRAPYDAEGDQAGPGPRSSQPPSAPGPCSVGLTPGDSMDRWMHPPPSRPCPGSHLVPQALHFQSASRPAPQLPGEGHEPSTNSIRKELLRQGGMSYLDGRSGMTSDIRQLDLGSDADPVLKRRRFSDSSMEGGSRDTPDESTPLLHPLMRASHLDPAAAGRPQLTSGDRQYLRKRKLAMDEAFNADCADATNAVYA